MDIIGTIFSSHSLNLSEADVRANIITSYSPPLVNAQQLQDAADRLLELYPDDPALGSPFNTGDNLFGLPSSYKREAAMGESQSETLMFVKLISIFINEEGDLSFQAPRRQWIQTASKAGVKTFGYLFTQPQPNGAPENGGKWYFSVAWKLLVDHRDLSVARIGSAFRLWCTV